jgi:hypothetical protein
MSQERINLNKQVFSKTQYERTINTNFTQLVTTAVETGSILPSIDEFFSYYQALFFDIPKFGPTNSHEYLIKTSQDYIGASNIIDDQIQALIDEVTELRQDNLDLLQQITDLQNQQIQNG